MHTLTLRQLAATAPPRVPPDEVLEGVARAYARLIDAEVHATETPVFGAGGPEDEVARRMRWQSHNTRNRLVLETTWHRGGPVVVDATLAASPFHRYAALWEMMCEAAGTGYNWIATWWEEESDQVLKDHHFEDSHSLWRDSNGELMAPLGRTAFPDGISAEWLRLTPRQMPRLLRFAWDCKIEWEALIVEDLMTRPPVAYVELRAERETIALARVLRKLWLPGLEGYYPRSKTPPVELEIESLEVHPDRKGKGYGHRLVDVIKAMHRPVSTLDTYRRAEPFWQRVGFQLNPRRSARADSTIFEWTPVTGPVRRLGVPAP